MFGGRPLPIQPTPAPRNAVVVSNQALTHRVFQAVGLLDEEHVAVVLRSLYYFRHGLARVQVDFHVLVVLWRLRS